MCLRSTIEEIITIPINFVAIAVVTVSVNPKLFVARQVHHILSQYLLRDILLPGKTGEITKWTFDAKTIQLWDEGNLWPRSRGLQYSSFFYFDRPKKIFER